MFSFLLCIALASLSPSRAVGVALGEPVQLDGITSSAPAALELQLAHPGQAVRLLMSSEEATVEQPLLVAISQARGVVSWQLPHVEGGFAYSSLERTLCPLQNGQSEQLFVQVTTSSTLPLSLSFNSSSVQGYQLQLGVPVSLTATPASPAFFLFDFAGEEVSRVKVRFTSEGPSSTLCSIASVQRSFCPVVELLDNPQHRGAFQSMRTKATIDAQAGNVTVPLYAVVSVLPADDCELSDAVRFANSFVAMATSDNYNPMLANISSRLKEVTIVVETALEDGKYAVAMVVAAAVYLSFYVIALGWIIVFDWWRYADHPLRRLLRRQTSGEGEETTDGGPDSLELSGTTDRGGGAAEKGIGLKSFFKRTPPPSADSAVHRLMKRPSLLSVLRGSHLDSTMSKVSPTNASSSSLSAPQQQSRTLTPRNRVRSESYPPIRGAKNLSFEKGDDEPDIGESCDLNGGSYDAAVEVRRHSTLEKKDSYREAVENGNSSPAVITEEEMGEGGALLKFDSPPLPINLVLSELPEFDEPSRPSLEHNGLACHLLTVIIFYAVPAVQLVSTFQKLVTLSGNEDICYFNSLCSHPWQVTSSFTITAVNNIFSNISYFILGFLYLLLTFRRRTIYRAFEQHNAGMPKEERVGVPQYFGIYYAIGLALMGEALMSSVYHICPSNTNYQFDTTFMFVLCTLGLYQLLVARSPDLRAGMHRITLLLAAIILVVAVGVVYSSSIAFYVLFALLYLLTSLFLILQFYYRWQLLLSRSNWWAFLSTFWRPSRPKQIPKFVMALLLAVVNIALSIFAAVGRPADFASYFLAALLVNFVLALFYYVATKCAYREMPSGRPMLYFALSVFCWGGGVYFYLTAVTDWLRPPAVSRDGNQECIVLEFFDAHDCWHFVSAFALFFSFLMLMSLDDRQEGRRRSKLRTF